MVQKTTVSAVETARRGLCQLIATGELAAGAPLPSEAELCERFGLSLKAVRARAVRRGRDYPAALRSFGIECEWAPAERAA